jgi:myo-inositol-1(or 4)-monophosphatase
MTTDHDARLHEAWLDCAAHMAAAGRQAARPLYGTTEGRMGLGRGAGGDETLQIDLACEKAMREVLRAEAPAPFILVSEEAGIVPQEGLRPEDRAWRVVVDPLDGSLNAKRGLETFGASIAVAAGDTLADVRVGYIEDYTRPRAFAAIKGRGLLHAASAAGSGVAPGGSEARVGGSWQPVTLDQGRFDRDLVEMVLLEAGRPDRHHFEYHDLSLMGAVGRSKDLRIRQLGSLALSLCYVATGVADMLVAAVRSRSVDIAAGLLILAEAGGGAAALMDENLLGQALDLEKRCGFVAWRAGLDGADIGARGRQLGYSLMFGR